MQLINNTLNLKLIAICVFVCSFPFKLILAPVTFVLIVIAFFLEKDYQNFWNNLKSKNGITLILVFFLWLIFSTILSDTKFNYKSIDNQLFMFLIPLFLVGFNLTKTEIYSIKKVYILSWVLFCIYAFVTLAYNLVVNFEHKQDYNFVQTSLYHFHYPYDVLYINIAYIVLIFIPLFKSVKLLFSVLFFVFIFLSGTRMGFFIFSLTSLIFLLLNIKKFLNTKSLLILVFILIISTLSIKNSRYVNDKFFDTLSKIGFNTSSKVSEIGEKYHKISLRQILWSSATKSIKTAPNKFIGYGANGAVKKLNKLYKEKGFNNIEKMNSHNQYLTTMLNSGIIGVLILTSIFIFAIFHSYQLKSLSNLLIIIAIMMSFLTESMLERQKGVIVFAFFLTLIMLENRTLNKENN